MRTDGIEPTKVFRDDLGEIDDYSCEVDVPQYSQMVRSPNISGVMCSAATCAMLVNSVSQMEGAPLNLLPEEIAMGCFDFRALSRQLVVHNGRGRVVRLPVLTWTTPRLRASSGT